MMKLQNVPLDQIVSNPWRDTDLYPIDPDRVKELCESIDDHEFFQSLKGRRRNGKVEIGCGHTRVAAARKAKLATVPVYIDDLDDDAMLHVMTDENATQSGTNPGAVANEVAAVTRRLIQGLLEAPTNVGTSVAKAFEKRSALAQAQNNLRANKDVHRVLGEMIIRRYLGQGNPDRSHRPAKAIREAMALLKQSGHYDDIVEETIAKYPPPVDESKSATKKTELIKAEPRTRRPIIYDARCANVFENDHQSSAFRTAVTTSTAQKFIPVKEQHALAKSIVDNAVDKRKATATYVKRMVQAEVTQAVKEQRNIDKEEQAQILREQSEERIKEQVSTATMYARSLRSAVVTMIGLADEFPGHPRLGGFSAMLDGLVNAIQQLSKKFK